MRYCWLMVGLVPLLATSIQAAPAPDASALLTQLAADDPVEFRIAQAMLAYRGTDALPELERAAKDAKGPVRQRLKELVALMLVRSVNLKEMKKYPNLFGLPAEEFRFAEAIAKPLAQAKEYDSGEQGSVGPNAPPQQDSPHRRAVKELAMRGGYAIPAVVGMSENAGPESMMYAGEILIRMGADGQIETLTRLSDQTVPVAIFHGCYTSRPWVGTELRDWMRRTHPFVRRFQPNPSKVPSFDAEDYLWWLDRFQRPDVVKSPVYTDLINKLRQDAGTMESESFREYLHRARPVLREVWKKGSTQVP